MLAPKNLLHQKWLTTLVFHGKAMFISIKPNISIMEDMVGMFAQKMGIPPELARMGLSLVSKFFLQNSNPNEASGLLSSLPGLSDMFSDDERRQFTTRQDNVPQEDLLAMLRNQLGGDNAQSQRFFEEGTRLLQDRTGQQGLFDNVMRNLKKSSF
jgi:hypothetical protein